MGVIRNVALLGKRSKNGRVYSKKAMEDAVRLNRGVPFMFDHPTDRELRDRGGHRSVLEIAGRIKNTRVARDRVRGDIHVLKEGRNAAFLFELAETMPDIAGNSIRASGKVTPGKDGEPDVVESLDRIFAVELVADPATTDGLFESIEAHNKLPKESEMDIKTLTLAEIHQARPDLLKEHDAGSAASRAAAKTLAENEKLKAENEKLKTADALRECASLVEAKLKEAKLPDTAVSQVFRKQLEEAADDAAVDVLIKDRQEMVAEIGKKTVTRSTGRDFSKIGHEGADEFEPVTEDAIGNALGAALN